MYLADLNEVVFWLKAIAALNAISLAAILIFRNPPTQVVSRDKENDHRESWKPFPGYDGTQEY